MEFYKQKKRPIMQRKTNFKCLVLWMFLGAIMGSLCLSLKAYAVEEKSVLEQGKEFYEKGEYASALQMFNQAWVNDPNNSLIKNYKALSERRIQWKSQEEEMLKHVQALVASEADDLKQNELYIKRKEAEYLFKQGQEKVLSQEFELALRLFKKARDIYPEYPLLNEYNELAEKGKAYQNEIEKERFRTLGVIIEINKEIKNIVEKRVEFEKMLSQGQELFDQAMYPEALEHFKKFQDVYPKNQILEQYVQLCRIASQNQAQGAIHNSEIEKIERKNEKVEELISEGKQLYDQKEYAKSLEVFKQVLELKPGHDIASRYVATIAKQIELQYQHKEEQQKRESQLKEQKQILELINQGSRLVDQKEYEKAAQVFQSVLEKDPNNESAQKYMAAVSKQLEIEKKIAPDQISNMLQENSEASAKLFEQGKQWLESKEYDKAIEAFKKAWYLNVETAQKSELQRYLEQAYALKQKAQS